MLSPVAFASRRISCVAGLLSCAFRKPGEKKDWNTRSGAEPFKISVSMGYAKLDPSDTETFLREMDERMYEEKRRYHQLIHA